MIMTTDVFSIAGTDAHEILHHGRGGETLDCLRATSIGPRQLARLAELLDLAGYDAAIRRFSLLAGESQEPPWVVSFPDDLALKISAMDSRETAVVAAMWSQSPELVGLMSDEALSGYLDGLRGLMQRSLGPYVLYVILDTSAGQGGST